MTPVYEANKTYITEKCISLISIFPLNTIGFMWKATSIHCLAYYIEDTFVLAITVRFTNGKYTIIANESVDKKFILFKAKNPVEEKMLFDSIFEKLKVKIILEGVRDKIEKIIVSKSLTDEKINQFKNEGILIC